MEVFRFSMVRGPRLDEWCEMHQGDTFYRRSNFVWVEGRTIIGCSNTASARGGPLPGPGGAERGAGRPGPLGARGRAPAAALRVHVRQAGALASMNGTRSCRNVVEFLRSERSKRVENL